MIKSTSLLYYKNKVVWYGSYVLFTCYSSIHVPQQDGDACGAATATEIVFWPEKQSLDRRYNIFKALGNNFFSNSHVHDDVVDKKKVAKAQ